MTTTQTHIPHATFIQAAKHTKPPTLVTRVHTHPHSKQSATGLHSVPTACQVHVPLLSIAPRGGVIDEIAGLYRAEG